MFETARPFLLSLALGLVIGIERERALGERAPTLPIGSRTFTLLALLGTLTAHVGQPLVAAVLAAFAGAIILAAYLQSGAMHGAHALGATTEVAAMATFGLGYLAHSDLTLAAMLGVIVLAVLALKPRIHEFAHAGLNPREVAAALGFLVIAFVVLPLLPNETVDAWNLVNPFRLWMLFVLIAGIGFGGYIAVRALGPAQGLAAAGFCAGLVSSTVATLTLSRRGRQEAGLAGPLATGIVLANVASAAAQIAVVAVAFPAMTAAALIVIGAPTVTGLVGSLAAVAWMDRTRREEPAGTQFGIENPLGLRSAALLAAALALFLVAASAAARWLGTAGVLGVAVIGGTTDVHAVTLAMSTLAAAGSIPVPEAIRAILVAFLCNMVVKLAIVGWAGGRKLFLPVAPPLLSMMAAGVAAYLIYIAAT